MTLMTTYLNAMLFVGVILVLWSGAAGLLSLGRVGLALVWFGVSLVVLYVLARVLW